MYENTLFNMQVRYTLGYDIFLKGDFDIRTLYNFHQRFSRHRQETGENLLDQAFAQVTDEQLEAFQLIAGVQRMDPNHYGSEQHSTDGKSAIAGGSIAACSPNDE